MIEIITGMGVGERGTPAIRSPMALKIKRNKNHIKTVTAFRLIRGCVGGGVNNGGYREVDT